MSVGVSIFLMAVALLASVISAIFGLAGGAVFFSALVWVVDAKTAVPIHSGVQLMSNTARVGVYVKEIQWRIVLWFSILLIPGAYLGSLLFNYFNTNMMEGLVGIFIIGTAFLPKSLPIGKSKKSFILVGFISAFLGMIVAVTGPLIASFLNISDVRKEQMVATKSVCQGLTQLVKLVMFATVVKFDFGDYLIPLMFFGVASLIGTFIGKKVIGKLSDGLYDKLNKWLLIVIGANMLLKALL
ncbi:MAG: putative membrane protein YfcA [Flammeovirgaceae bacterium]|jgi:uncharacterized membrane protein YfcA